MARSLCGRHKPRQAGFVRGQWLSDPLLVACGGDRGGAIENQPAMGNERLTADNPPFIPYPLAMSLPPIILASASPRRAELLRQIVDEFEIIPGHAEEFQPEY